MLMKSQGNSAFKNYLHAGIICILFPLLIGCDEPLQQQPLQPPALAPPTLRLAFPRYVSDVVFGQVQLRIGFRETSQCHLKTWATEPPENLT